MDNTWVIIIKSSSHNQYSFHNVTLAVGRSSILYCVHRYELLPSISNPYIVMSSFSCHSNVLHCGFDRYFIMVGEMEQNSQIPYSFTFNNFILIHKYIHSHLRHIFIHIQGENFYLIWLLYSFNILCASHFTHHWTPVSCSCFRDTQVNFSLQN